MSLVLYRKWRPRRWEQVVGQEHVIRTLQNAVAAERISHAYLFAGPRGTGKTTTARLVAKAVNCLDPDPAQRPCDECEICQAIQAGRFLDLIEIDAASNTSVDDVRDLREKINFAPNQGHFKVYIIDEVHMLSTAAFNALLKTLEEPPPHAIFILATTEVHKIPTTVLSRCQRHEFRFIPVADMVAQLERLAEEEDLTVEAEALTLVARQATGSLRDAISLLDQLASTGEPITLNRAQTVLGTAASQAVLEIVEALLDGQAAAGLDRLRAALDGGSDARQLARQIVDYLRNLLLIQMGNGEHVDVTADLRARMAAHAQRFATPHLLEVIRSFNEAAGEARHAWQPSLPLELAFVASLEVPAQASPPPTQPAQSGQGRPADAGQPVARQPAQDPATSPAAEAEAAAEGAVSMHQITRAWQEILLAVRRRNPQTQGLLNSCQPLGVKSDTLVLAFASELLKSKMEKPEHLQHAQAALQQVLGVEVGIRCIVSATAQGGQMSNLRGLDSDGIVAVAVRDLGGEIVDIQ